MSTYRARSLQERVHPKAPQLLETADVECVREVRALALSKQESALVLLLDGLQRLKYVETISIGTANASIVHPRDVFRLAIEANACGVILVHNHPSGYPTPSEEDKAITTRLHAAGELLGIELVDHVIVAASGYRSLRADGFFPGGK